MTLQQKTAKATDKIKKGNMFINTHPRLKILRIAIIACLIVAIAWYFSPMGQNTLAGRVEATLIAHASEVQGKIIQVPVSLGETVKAGDIIAIIDSTQQKYALEQLKQVLLQKQSALNLLEKAADDETTRQAQNQVTVAQAAYGSAQAAYANAKAAYNTALNNYEKAKSDYEAYGILYQDGGISASEYENIKLAFTAAANAKETAQNNMNIAQNSVNAAQAQADSAKQQLNNIYEGSDDDTLVAAAAAVAQAESQISAAQDILTKYTIKAGCDGTIMSLNYNIGDIVSAGYNIADIANASGLYVLTYWPEKWINEINYGDEVNIKISTGEITGQIIYIDVKAQYTPKDMQTTANKNKDSFKVKISLPAGTAIKPGEDVAVRP